MGDDLRVALVTGTLQLGGSTTFLCNLSGELIRRGIECRVYSGDNLNELASDFERQRIPVSVQDHAGRIFEDRIDATLRELRDYRPHIVVATLAPFAYEILRYLPPGTVRLAMAQADDRDVYRVIAHYAQFVDGVVGVSATIARKLSELDAFRETPIHCLSYGVPSPNESVDRLVSSNPLRILYLGRLLKDQKRVHLFPEIFDQLCAAAVPFAWTIAGEGADRAEIESRMKSPGPNQRVHFTGPVAYSDVPNLLRANDVFILTSDYEGLPLSLLEAMAFGLVPVVSDLESGIREVVNEKSGLLVSAEDVDGYARAILHLHGHRDELAAKSAVARRAVREKFSVPAMADRWLSVLKRPEYDIAWPSTFDVRGPILDAVQWKHAVVLRPLRRLTKKLTAKARRKRC